MFFLEGAGMLLMAGFAPVSFWITLGAVPFGVWFVFVAIGDRQCVFPGVCA
jgi:hypothetical protein